MIFQNYCVADKRGSSLSYYTQKLPAHSSTKFCAEERDELWATKLAVSIDCLADVNYILRNCASSSCSLQQ